MKDKKGLQKLSESEKRINEVMNLKQITENDLKSLSEDEQRELMTRFNAKFADAKGIERDRMWEQVESIAEKETRNRLWENNHDRIVCAIANHIQEYGRMPLVSTLADNTKLSRQTISKHLKEYASDPLYLEQQEQFRFMTSKVLARIYTFAVNGDISAAKLYLNAMGCLNGGANAINIQNQQNNIQINNTVINQALVETLNEEQIAQIEAILKTVG